MPTKYFTFKKNILQSMQQLSQDKFCQIINHIQNKILFI